MLDPLMTLLVAKAKAVSLVAGTALATTALVGGGAVAYTAVSSDTELTPETSVSQDVDSTQALPADDATVSATPTVGIETPTEETAPVQVDEDADGLDDATGLPMGFVCDDTKNHGQNVSAFARSLPKGPGRGQLVSAVAKSDCGKSAETVETEEAELEATEAEETEETEEAKPVKAQKPAKAEKPAKAQKPAKADKPAKAQKPAKADKPAKSGKPAKAEGKGGNAKGGNGRG